MKNLIALPFIVLGASLQAGDIRLESCPAPVKQTIQANARGGSIDDVDVIQAQGRTLYVAEVDLPGRQGLKIHVGADGKLLKTSEDVKIADLPAPVRQTVDKEIAKLGRLDDLDKETVGDKTTFRAEIDRSAAPDVNLVIADNGSILSRKEQSED